MHILFFINSLGGGGAERVTVNLANHWAEKGWQVTIVTLMDQSEDAYAISPKVQRIALERSAESPSLLSGVINNFDRVRALKGCLKQEKPDIVISMMTAANCLLALAGRQGAKQIIGSERTYAPRFPLGRVWETARKYLYRRLDTVVALTQESHDWLSKSTNAKNITVIPNPVPFPVMSTTPHVPPARFLKQNHKAMLAVGRLDKGKAFDRLIEAFAAVSAKSPSWDLVIVGDGPERAALMELAQKRGIGEKLILPGRVGNIADWYAAADAFALTSLFEGFPNVLVEAMAHGLPVVSVDCDTGPRDIITDGQDGLLIEQTNPEALEGALRRLMEDPALRQKLAHEAVKVRERFSMLRIAAMWEDLF